tara:strand:- start:20156 stop:20923 length:768 start_codon:yes stop_codon:yes gene_type:complete
MNDKSELIKKYDDKGLSFQELGKLRRILLGELLDSIVIDTDNIKQWLDEKETKFDTSKLAKAVGYDTKAHNIRQSFKKLVKGHEDQLREDKILKGDAKLNTQIREENVRAFTTFLNERLSEPDYNWPKNLKGFLYRKGIWGYFLDTPPKDVTYLPSFFNNDEKMEELLSSIDVKIAKEEVKSIGYERESALDEMSETMTSYALSSLRQKLKAKTEEVVMLRVDLNDLQLKLNQYEWKEKARLKGEKEAFKSGSIH